MGCAELTIMNTSTFTPLIISVAANSISSFGVCKYIIALGLRAFQIAYYAFEQCYYVPIMLHKFIKLSESKNNPIFITTHYKVFESTEAICQLG